MPRLFLAALGLAILTSSCSSADEPAIEGTWLYESFDGNPVEVGESAAQVPTFSFRDGVVRANAGCNEFLSDYELDGAVLVLTGGSITEAGCESADGSERVMASELGFREVVFGVERIDVIIDDGRMTWTTANGELTFTAAASDGDGDAGAAGGGGDAAAAGGTTDGVARPASRTVEGLDNVENSLFALGSVWAVTSNRPDEFSRGPIEAQVVRIDPVTGRAELVLDSPGIEPTLAEVDGRVWVGLVDRLAALDETGAEVESLAFEPGDVDGHAAGGGRLWTVATGRDRVTVIDPTTTRPVRTIDTGDYPVTPLAAFGHVWIPALIDGTVTIVAETAGGTAALDGAEDADASPLRPVVMPSPKTLTAVPAGATGDEVWVTGLDGGLAAVSAEDETLGNVRTIEVGRSINRVIVDGDRAFLLPTWGQSVLAIDLRTEELLAEIPIGSIPVRAVAAHGSIWVTSDGGEEALTVIDPESLAVTDRFRVGANRSNTNGPQQPFVVDGEVWVPNRGDGVIFIVEAAALSRR